MLHTMKLIYRDDLKVALDRDDDVKLVMVLSEWAYLAKHIPGSLNINTPAEALRQLKPEDDIIVYCANTVCHASIFAYQMLERHGYQHVRRYAGGLEDWEEAGYPLVGEAVETEQR